MVRIRMKMFIIFITLNSRTTNIMCTTYDLSRNAHSLTVKQVGEC